MCDPSGIHFNVHSDFSSSSDCCRDSPPSPSVNKLLLNNAGRGATAPPFWYSHCWHRTLAVCSYSPPWFNCYCRWYSWNLPCRRPFLALQVVRFFFSPSLSLFQFFFLRGLYCSSKIQTVLPRIVVNMLFKWSSLVYFIHFLVISLFCMRFD